MSIIKRQTILSTIYSYLGVFVGLATQWYLIPQYFTTQQNGLLNVLLSWMYIICQVASLGFNHAGTKFFPFFRNDKKKHNGYLNLGLKFNFLGLAICIILLFVFKNQIVTNNLEVKGKGTDSELFSRYFFVLIPISLGTVLFNIFDNYAKGLYDSVAGSFYAQFLQRFFLFIVALVYAGKYIDFNSFMYLWVVAITAPTLFMIVKAISLGNFSLKATDTFKNSEIRKPFINFATFSIVTGLSSIVILQLDKIMINQYLGLSKTGIYSTVGLFSSVMGMTYLAVVKASSALVVNALEAKEYEKVESIYKKSSINLFLFGLLLLLGVWINIDDLFSFIKPEFSIGKIALIIIGIGKLYDLLHGINGLILSNSNYYKLDSFFLISFVVLLYFLNQWLIPIYGLNGAAIAALIAVFYYNTIRTIIVWKIFKIQPFGVEQLYSLLVFGVVLFIMLNFPDTHNAFINIAIKSCLATVLFVVPVYFLRISNELNGIIEGALKKLIRN